MEKMYTKDEISQEEMDGDQETGLRKREREDK